ncbi:MBG domain-containing protein, partial [Flavobacterium sp. ZT3R17]|uniref:MBG domain-containing protein n=1 Tax=Flavobacterium cryoconiti TaxID=3398736 RepID=UPI003A8AC697
SYSLVYRICEILNPTNCDNATVTVTVTAPVIDAINDAGTAVNGFTGGTAFTNVLSNDTLNGVAVVPAQVNTTFVSATNAGITLSGTNVIIAAGTPAGSYSLVYRICEILNPTNCDNATVTVTVTAPVIDAINDAGTTVYGSTNETAFTNVLSNDTLNGVDVVPAQVNTTFVSATNAGITLSGTNVIVAAGTPAGSYSLVYRICEILNPTNCDNATVTVTVTPKALNVAVVADDKTKVYGDVNPALTAVVTGAVNGDTINYTLATTATQFSNVGDYPIAVTLGTNPNYTVAYTDATLTVTPKALNVTVVADDKSKVYGDVNPALTAVVTGAVNGDTINYTLATTATQFSNVGDYPIAVTLGTNPNYTVAYTDATLTVTPKALNVTVVADDKTKVYGDVNPALTAVVTGAVNGDTINYTLATTATQFSNVG